MSRSQRRIDPSKELTRLEMRHHRLSQEVEEYEARLSLNAQEQMDLQKLKKEKLATKDRIFRMTQV